MVLGTDRRCDDELARDAVVVWVLLLLRQRGRARRHVIGEGTLVDPVVGSLILDVDGCARAAAGLLQVLVHQVVIRIGEVNVFVQDLLLLSRLLLVLLLQRLQARVRI